MSFLVLDIPDQDSELPAWLERELVGLHLADLIAGLEVFQGEPRHDMELDTALEGNLEAVLEHGLGALTDQQVRNLLQHPRLLAPLQERVLLEGGAHWERIPLSRPHEQLTADCWTSVCAAGSPRVARPDPVPRGNPAEARRFPWAVTLSAAALLLVAVFGWQQFSSRQPAGWGWNKPGALADAATAPDYLLQLAAGANDWFNKRPDTPEDLATRLTQFRKGCETLIAAPHRPLAPEDRAWLVERCQAWSSKLETHITALESGADVEEVRADADATINKLIEALKQRAAQVA